MLKSLQLFCESRGAIVSSVAILLASAILFAFVLPISAEGFDHVALALPVLFFCLLLSTENSFGWVLSAKTLSIRQPFLTVSYGRAPPA